MRSGSKSAVGVAVVAIAGLLFVASALQKTKAADADLKPAISSLAYFTGDWECAGKFDSSGKTIEAHDDKPPFSYHALAEWGWDSVQKEFVMTVQDSAGGVRLFHSNGWNSTQLQWDGDAVGGASDPDQRFSFERLDERHFKVSYFTLKNGGWSRVDSSTCSKQ
jgi:hypothetical protein